MSWSRDENGLKYIDTAEILKQVQDAFKKAFPGISIDPSTPQGQIITYFTENLAKCQADIAYFANMFTNGGSGVWLDIRNQALYGISRKPAVKSTVTAEITGVPGTTIPIGFKAESTGKKVFETATEYIIGSSGRVNAFMVAEDTGDFQILAGTLTSIVSQIVGVERIRNPQNSTKGVPLESDQEFRARADKSLEVNAVSVFGGLLAKLSNLDGVVKVGGSENSTNTPVNFEVAGKADKVKPPHSINLIILGGDDNEIARTILTYKNPGCAMGGDEPGIEVVEPISKQKYMVRFYRPMDAELKCRVKVSLSAADNQNSTDKIRDKIIGLIDALEFGSTIFPLNILNDIGNIGIRIIDLKMSLKSSENEPDYDPIYLKYLDRAVIAKADIDIVME